MSPTLTCSCGVMASAEAWSCARRGHDDGDHVLGLPRPHEWVVDEHPNPLVRYRRMLFVHTEAMAAGLPLLVSDTGPIARLVEQSDCGRVAGVGDVEALADHLVAMAADPQQARDQGANAMAAAGRFTPAATSEAINAILSAMTHPGRAQGLTTDPARS